MQGTATTAAVICTAMVVVASSSLAFGEPARKPLYVLVVGDDDDGMLTEQIRAGMSLPDPSGMKDYLAGFDVQVIPFGSVDLSTIESVTLPAIRAIPEYKDAPFVFVYQPSTKGQFNSILTSHFGTDLASMQDGWTDISHGVSFAPIYAGTIFHESRHLVTCSTWHDAYGNPLTTATRYPDADKYPWC